jgi:hypothetical protein
MNKKQLLEELHKSVRASKADTVDIFKVLHHKHGGLDERDIAPNSLRALIRIVLKKELESATTPSVLVEVLVSTCRRSESPVQVDMLIHRWRSIESIPYIIAKSSHPTKTKLVWLKAIAEHTELREYFDLNRPVGSGGNLVVNSYAKLKICDIEWYEYLLLDLHLAVNTKNQHRTLKDWVIQDIERGTAPKCAKKLLDLLAHCGGKTRVELNQ